MRTFATCFAVHLGGAAIAWLIVNDPNPGVWTNGEFGQWIVLALVLAVAVTVVVAARGGSRLAFGAAVGSLVAVVFECTIFVASVVLNSA